MPLSKKASEVDEAELPVSLTDFSKIPGQRMITRKAVTIGKPTDYVGPYEKVSKSLENTVAFLQSISNGSLEFNGCNCTGLVDPMDPKNGILTPVVIDDTVYLSDTEFLAILKLSRRIEINKEESQGKQASPKTSMKLPPDTLVDSKQSSLEPDTLVDSKQSSLELSETVLPGRFTMTWYQYGKPLTVTQFIVPAKVFLEATDLFYWINYQSGNPHQAFGISKDITVLALFENVFPLLHWANKDMCSMIYGFGCPRIYGTKYRQSLPWTYILGTKHLQQASTVRIMIFTIDKNLI
jgi:hypothetical protein